MGKADEKCRCFCRRRAGEEDADTVEKEQHSLWETNLRRELEVLKNEHRRRKSFRWRREELRTNWNKLTDFQILDVCLVWAEEDPGADGSSGGSQICEILSHCDESKTDCEIKLYIVR